MMRVITATFAALLIGWIARGLTVGTVDDAMSERPAHHAPAVQEPSIEPDMLDVAKFEQPRAGRGARNIFQYREAPPTPVRTVVSIATPPVPSAPPPPQDRSEAPVAQAPKFSGRLIGTFGTRDMRLAAFVRDGEVITLRAGDRVGSDFVVRSVAVGSVEVQALSAPAAAPQRIALESAQ